MNVFFIEETSVSENNCPLESVKIQARLVNFIAEVTMELQYLNKADCLIDIKRHRLPIEQGAAVVECSAKIDGDTIEMKVKEELTAKQEIQDEGRSAILVEQLNPDTLGISINRLGPNTKAVVSIKYLIELSVNGAVTQLVIPAMISPIVRLEVEVITIMYNRIKSISSPSHTIKSSKKFSFSRKKCIMETSLADNEMRKQTDDDFILFIESEDPKGPMVFVEEGQDGGKKDAVLIVSFVPTFDLPQAPKEIIAAERSEAAI